MVFPHIYIYMLNRHLTLVVFVHLYIVFCRFAYVIDNVSVDNLVLEDCYVVLVVVIVVAAGMLWLFLLLSWWWLRWSCLLCVILLVLLLLLLGGGGGGALVPMFFLRVFFIVVFHVSAVCSQIYVRSNSRVGVCRCEHHAFVRCHGRRGNRGHRGWRSGQGIWSTWYLTSLDLMVTVEEIFWFRKGGKVPSN